MTTPGRMYTSGKGLASCWSRYHPLLAAERFEYSREHAAAERGLEEDANEKRGKKKDRNDVTPVTVSSRAEKAWTDDE